MLAEAQIFFNGALKAFCTKAYESGRIPDKLYSSKDEMQQFTQEQVKSLSAPMEIEDKEKELFTFLDLLFRSAVTSYQDLLQDGEIDSDEILTWDNVTYDVFYNADINQLKFLDEIKYEFTLDDFARIESALNTLSTDEAFDQDQWFLDMKPLFLKYRNLRADTHVKTRKSLASNHTFPICFKSPDLRKKFLDFLIENKVPIIENVAGDALHDYVRYHPDLVEHLITKHSDLFDNFNSAAISIMLAVKEFFLNFQNDILTPNEFYTRNLKLLKQSLEALEANGFDLRKPAEQGLGIESLFLMLEHGSKVEIDGQIYELDAKEQESLKSKLEYFRKDLGF